MSANKRKKSTAETVVIAVITVAVLLIFCKYTYDTEVTSGTVIDKAYSSAYTDAKGKHHKAKWYIEVEGEQRNGKYGIDRKSVSQGKYTQYKIGDPYP